MQKYNYKDKWVEDDFAGEIKQSAIKLASAVANEKDVLEKHKKQAISLMFWWVTESSGKHNTRFISEGVYNGKTPIEHEHVIPRKELVAQIMDNPQNISDLFGEAIGCLVTKEEHGLLPNGNVKKGWERYKFAGIKVYDRLNQKWLF